MSTTKLCDRCEPYKECAALAFSDFTSAEMKQYLLEKHYHQDPNQCVDPEGREAMGLEVQLPAVPRNELRERYEAEYPQLMESAIKELVPLCRRVGVPSPRSLDFYSLHEDIQIVLEKYNMQVPQDYLSLFGYVREIIRNTTTR